MKLTGKWLEAYWAVRRTVIDAAFVTYALIGGVIVYGAWLHATLLVAAAVLGACVFRAAHVIASAAERAAKAHKDLAEVHRDIETRMREYIEFEFKSVR